MDYSVDDLISFIGRGDEHVEYYKNKLRERILDLLATAWNEGFDEASDDIGLAQILIEDGNSENPYLLGGTKDEL